MLTKPQAKQLNNELSTENLFPFCGKLKNKTTLFVRQHHVLELESHVMAEITTRVCSLAAHGF